ncbi:hypothetical protein AB0K16_44575 [Nonomuraea jabiensis]|uniref:hypothetical protein n=1 Tax=Nonomuraea jabiensis TaxID=882448 RepID=UPI003446CF6B
MSITDELVANAERYAESFQHGALALPPAKRLAVVACMDARLNVYGLLGLREGDAHVIRNAGGIKPDWAAEAFTDLEEDVVQSVRRIRQDPFIPHKDAIRGFVYDVTTGRLGEVKL